MIVFVARMKRGAVVIGRGGVESVFWMGLGGVVGVLVEDVVELVLSSRGHDDERSRTRFDWDRAVGMCLAMRDSDSALRHGVSGRGTPYRGCRYATQGADFGNGTGRSVNEKGYRRAGSCCENIDDGRQRLRWE